MTNKWIKVNDLSSSQYSIKNKIGFKTSILRSDFCDSYIVVKRRASVTGTNDCNKRNKKLTSNNNVWFIP